MTQNTSYYLEYLVIILAVAVSISVCLSWHAAFADANSDQSHKYYFIGKFTNANPSKPDQMFIFPYKILDGNISAFKGVYDKDRLSVEVHTTNDTSLEIEFPRNYPFTNEITNVVAPPMSIMNGKVIPPSAVNDCFFVYSFSLNNDSTIEFLFSTLVSENSSTFPYHGENIPSYCISETISSNSTNNVETTIPEFPFASTIFIISIASLVIFYRLKFG